VINPPADRDLLQCLSTLLDALSGVQAECSAQSSLIGEHLPGLTVQQRRSLQDSSKQYATLAERSKENAKLLNACVQEQTAA
jgi:hypothetical protein